MFSADTECARLMRDLDWSANPLGPPPTWPTELKTLVGIMLGSRQPMFVAWGPHEIMLYNDAYALLCGARHPAIGVPFQVLWADILDDVYPILRAAYEGRSTHMEDISIVMHRNGYPEEAHFSFSYTPVRDARGNIPGMFCACDEITEQVRHRRAQEQERALLYEVLRLSPGATALVMGPDHVFALANERFLYLCGKDSGIIGRPTAEVLPEIVGQGFIRLMDQVFTTGTPYEGRDIPIDLLHDDHAEMTRHYVDFVYQPFADPMTGTRGVLIQGIDVTDRREKEERQRIIANELSHRMKNQLAVVRAVISQTMRRARDTREAAQVIDGRLMALGRAQNLLLNTEAEESTVAAVVRAALSPYDEGTSARYRLSGPHVVLGGQLVMSLSLVVHELGTNALKHGAFSVPEGQVDIVWGLETVPEGRRFTFDWREKGGPPVSEPQAKGSGSGLIAAGLGTFGGEVIMDFAPEGLHCRMSALLGSEGMVI
ncbi:hypothetical protein CDV50_02810 [Haematobacter massiliensis]|uniref:histidine kinase n=2 Tax=Haematobacter massiliensis TaxID=195105 RepID=A0A086Y8C5_9RHOB|nr:histidine kinase [Haematobacter massiliensis]OWJ73373.1 hypothetical protein CDV50_02810 [Haematobacter massiliensis]OWJ82309.1 hypothetical protein CDV51_17930 [Haematobacter massiliensis]QBJ24995.1 hypothetical protein HmaOT1_12515 [Haematobacter massiliensis]